MKHFDLSEISMHYTSKTTGQTIDMMSERRLAAIVCRAALAVCEYQWQLFMAHEERAAGHADRAAAHIDRARSVMESVQRTCRDLGPRTSANE